MVFDVRGKRRGVVKVVYAILAVLMGLSLFLLGAGGSLNSLFGSNSTTSANVHFEEQAERIEFKLKKEPEDADLLAALTKARINAGNGAVEANSAGQTAVTPESIQQYQLASEAWSEYLEATKEPNPNVALVVAPMFVTLAESNPSTEFKTNITAAAEAQEIVAAQRPTLNSLSTLAIFQYFTFDYAKAKKTEEKALALASSKSERETIEKQLKPYEERARKAEKQLKEAEVAQKQGAEATQKSGANPLSLGGASLGE